LKDILNNSVELSITATVSDSVKALELFEKLEFDVITLDIETFKSRFVASG
jgi:chemotaxis response regulator CheB